jgi:hypothetical protein
VVRGARAQPIVGPATGLLRKHGDLGGRRYRMREKLFSIGEDSWIENDDPKPRRAQDDALVLAVAVCIDELSERGR